MPQTFSLEQPRRRSSSASLIEGTNILHMPSILPEGTMDSDDSIVLSDLVRTGEASRLRRRGAMRIDHNHPHHATAAGHILPGPPRLSSPSVMVVERSNWDSDSEPDSPWFPNTWNADPHSNTFGRRHSRLSRRFGPYSGMSSGSPQQGARDEFSYTLVCGAEVSHCDPDEIEPFKPSVLPLSPLSPPTPSTRWKTTKKSTGCGAIVHLHAGPRHKFRFWTARSAGAEVVIPLDACYFDKKDAARFSRNTCGCVNEGVGCAICGNPLGTRYTPCKFATEGLLCRLQEKRPLIPGLSNPHSSLGETPAPPSKSSSSKSTQHVFTFFADAVTSTPSYSFSEPPVRPGRPGSYEISPLSSPTSPEVAAPERFLYPQEEDEESDTENYPPFMDETIGGPRWRSDPHPEIVSGAEMNTVTIVDSPVLHLPSTPPRDGILLDRFSNSSPMPEEREEPFEIWGQGLPAPLMTRTGRPARHTSIGRWYPSLSSGLGGGVHEEPQHTSFYERQLRAASERETGDNRPWNASTHGVPQLQTDANVGSSVFSLDADGEPVTWGAGVSDNPDSRALRMVDFGYDRIQNEQPADAEYKPGDWNFVER